MKLYLLRHGDADSRANDFERPLSEKGREVTQRLARFLKPLKIEVAAIWTSPLVRARETAEIIEPVIKPREGLSEQEGLRPEDPVKPLRRQIEKQAGDLLLVGHMPHLARLADLLLTGEESAGLIDFPKSGLLCLEHDGSWFIRWFLVPKILPD